MVTEVMLRSAQMGDGPDFPFKVRTYSPSRRWGAATHPGVRS